MGRQCGKKEQGGGSREEGAGRVAGMVALPSPHSRSVLDRDAFSQKIPELPLL